MTAYQSREALAQALLDKHLAHQNALNALLQMALEGSSPEEEAEFVDLLKFIHGQIQFASLSYLYACDPARPRMINPQYSPWNWGHSNPDTLYTSAVISEDYDYRVFGLLGTAAQNTFGVYCGIGAQSNAVKITSEELGLTPHSIYEIFISPERKHDDWKHWVETPAGVETFASYQVFSDWSTQQKGQIFIECLNPVEMLKPASMEKTLQQYDNYLKRLQENFKLWVIDIPEMMFSGLEDNSCLGPFMPPSAMAGSYFTAIKWRLEKDEALVVDLEIPPDSPYSSICLTNRWSQMIDIDCRQTSLNEQQSIVGEDRTLRILIADEDLGVHNWLDAGGYTNGIATWRTTSELSPAVPCLTRIKKSEVWGYFSEVQKISPDRRRETIRQRQQFYRLLDAV